MDSDAPAYVIRKSAKWRDGPQASVVLHLVSRDHHSGIDGERLASDEAAAGDEAHDPFGDIFGMTDAAERQHFLIRLFDGVVTWTESRLRPPPRNDSVVDVSVDGESVTGSTSPMLLIGNGTDPPRIFRESRVSMHTQITHAAPCAKACRVSEENHPPTNTSAEQC